MTPQFDVFRNDRSNEGTWLTAVNSVAEGQVYVNKLTAHAPGSYFIFSQKDATKQPIARPRLPAQSGLGGIKHPGDYSPSRHQASSRFFPKK